MFLLGFARNVKIFCRIYSGFKVIEAGIFFTETSDYFKKNLRSSYIDSTWCIKKVLFHILVVISRFP